MRGPCAAGAADPTGIGACRGGTAPGRDCGSACDEACCCVCGGGVGLGALEGTVAVGGSIGVWAGGGVGCGGGGSQGK